MRNAQISTEYLIVYAMALAVIGGSIVILFSLGIFNPSSYVSQNVVTGFGGLAVSQVCAPGGVLALDIENTNNYPIEITSINGTSSLNASLIGGTLFSTVLQTGVSQLFFVTDLCPTGSNTRYSSTVNVTYITGSNTNPGPFHSIGTVSGQTSSSNFNSIASFNGVSSFVSIQSNKPLDTGNSATIAAWVYWRPGAGGGGACCNTRQEIFGLDSSPNFEVNPILAINDSGSQSVESWVCANQCWAEARVANAISTGSWYLLVNTYNNSEVCTWVNGVKEICSAETGNLILLGSGDYAYIGARGGTGSFFNGFIMNAQAYVDALSAAQIQYLYSEGRFSPPLSGSNLIGWWPLQGNANDYSGHNNNGITTNIQWVPS